METGALYDFKTIADISTKLTIQYEEMSISGQRIKKRDNFALFDEGL